jgi:sulfite reductase alpha subunit-like flavoprotein
LCETIGDQKTKMSRVPGVVVGFGSQTGNATDVAQLLSRQLRMRGFYVHCLVLDELAVPMLQHGLSQINTVVETPAEVNFELAIFVVSTTGQGEVPDNMKQFWKELMKKSLPRDAFDGLNFTVFGLGDSSYPVFNGVARKLFQRLLNLGGKFFHNRGLGDDQDKEGYDTELGPWMEELWQILKLKYPGRGDVEASWFGENGWPRPSFEVELVKDDVEKKVAPNRPSEIGDSYGKVYVPFGSGESAYVPVAARVFENKRITAADHWQDVRHLDMEIPSSISYEPGDVLLLHPKNSREIVDKFITSRLKLEPGTLISVKPSVGSFEKVFFPSLITVSELFCEHLDVLSTPKRTFFVNLIQFATAEHEIEKLKDFSSAEGQEDLYKYANRERRTHLEVLEDFPSVKLPLQYWIEFVPRLQPRQFSISSSPLAHQGHVQLTVALVEYTTPYKRPKVGICSQWIKSLQAGDIIPVGIKKGSIELPSTPEKLSYIFIGPGTGIAPFRSMCHQLRMIKQQNPHAEDCKVLVFFGNRNASKDYFYKEEWIDLEESKTVNLFSTAFSRDQDEKIYVQHRLLENSEAIWNVMQTGNFKIMVAGSSGQMPKDVYSSFQKIVMKQTGASEEEVDHYLKKLQRSLQFVLECWA